MLERYNDPTGGPQGAISQANLGLTLSDLNLRINDALSAAIARASVHQGRGIGCLLRRGCLMRAYAPISSYLLAIAFFALDILRTMHLTPFMQICSLLPPSRFKPLFSASYLRS